LDSLTQIVLGAAVGEVVLGRKVGNRAMIWGAISGTVPDLDIIANAFMHPIEALAVHRGLSHSIFFAVLFPWVMGWLTHRYYEADWYRSPRVIWTLRGFLIALCLVFINGIAFEINQGISWSTALVTLVVVGLYIWRQNSQDRNPAAKPDATYMNWVHLHFWAVFTHPLLDSCTAYGTQLFQPFSDYRVALNNIAVADPAYTVPFLLFVLLASFFIKTSKWRKIFNWTGIAISCLYLAWTVKNKFHVNEVFESSLTEAGYSYDRYMTGPTILNNVLWYGVAQDGDQYYTGFYSILDKEERVKGIQTAQKNQHLLKGMDDHRHIEIVKWFSDGYYSTEAIGNGQLMVHDLRYGILVEEEGQRYNRSVFSFIVDTMGGQVEVRPNRERPPTDSTTFKFFWDRIRGE
jgi:inner membrane protein